MRGSRVTPQERYAEIVEALLQRPGVSVGSEKKGFGSSALQVNNKIFAMLSSKGGFVVKLPKQRVDELIVSGQGERFDPGHGRLMKEWLVADSTAQANWLALAREALEYVSSKG